MTRVYSKGPEAITAMRLSTLTSSWSINQTSFP